MDLGEKIGKKGMERNKDSIGGEGISGNGKGRRMENQAHPRVKVMHP